MWSSGDRWWTSQEVEEAEPGRAGSSHEPAAPEKTETEIDRETRSPGDAERGEAGVRPQWQRDCIHRWTASDRPMSVSRGGEGADVLWWPNPWRVTGVLWCLCREYQIR
ncbi:hypothetical protein NDU88_010546 [Pleurodeles waltl]|uniref:Uncharacterized protein n=1 Tax=Pleurodeles waltl TaxID=8319 RepID=A0AAV7S2Y7_PLEWA|nr:hypothetical protein NDU88_010546 [Pleurodeles waltl]